jgi:hypothetical protein
VADVMWSRYGSEDCLRVGGVAPDAQLRVRAGTAVVAGDFPPMAGRVVRDGDDVCFVPRFAFVEGTTYTVLVGGDVTAVLVRPRPDRPATTEVLDIRPSANEVPRNLLRFYVQFSARMSEGYAAGHVRLVDDAGEEMVGALLPTEHELWDADRRRLTVLLDPARIKRGLVAHREVGYPIRSGEAFRLVIDEGFCVAGSAPLRKPAARRYEVRGDERQHVDPELWRLTAPHASTIEALDVWFDRPLDHGLLSRCLRVAGPDGQVVDGASTIGPEERSWHLTPRRAWVPGAHRLVVDPVLEDVAGNSVTRVFDRDLSRVEDDPEDSPTVTRTFTPVPADGG